MFVAVGFRVGLRVGVRVGVEVDVEVAVAVAVGVEVGVAVGVLVGVSVGVLVGVGVSVCGIGVSVGNVVAEGGEDTTGAVPTVGAGAEAAQPFANMITDNKPINQRWDVLGFTEHSPSPQKQKSILNAHN